MSHSPEDLPPEPVFPVREETRTILTLREGAALFLIAAWLVVTGSFLYHGGLQTGSGSLTVVMALLAIFLPILLIGALVLMSRSLHEVRAQTGEMHQTLASPAQGADTAAAEQCRRPDPPECGSGAQA